MGNRFALDLRDDAVCLLERQDGAWTTLETLPIDDPGFPGNVRDAIALHRDGDALGAVVFLPPSQILYTDVDLDEGADRDEVADALAGLTPYTPDELSFDFATQDGVTKVAAVASVTLEETDQFAAACGIAVKAVSALPDAGFFDREPLFSGDPTMLVWDVDEDTEELDVEDEDAASEAPVFASQAQSSTPSRLSERMGRLSALAPTQQGTSENPRIATGRELTPPGVPDMAAAEASLRAAPPAVEAPKVPAVVAPVRSEIKVVPPKGTARPAGLALGNLPPQLARALADQENPKPKKPSKGLTPARKAMIGLTLAASVTTASVVGIFTYVLPPADAMLVPQDVVVTRALTPAEEETSAPAGSDLATLTAPAIEENSAVELPARLAPANEPVISTRSIDGIDQIEAEDAAPSIEVAIPADALISDPESTADATYEEVTYPEWTIAPVTIRSPEQTSVNEIYLAAIDPVTLGNDAVALPRAEASPVQPLTQVDPSPNGTEFDFDERGFVRATPEGALTPDGVLVVLGSPPVVPPTRPESTLQSAMQNGLRLTTLALEVPDDVKPRARPENLIELAERGRFGGRSVEELATIAPLTRPEALERDDADAVTLTASLRPSARPANWAAIVAAVETRETTPAPATDVAVASLAPATTAPSIPTSASVSREATLENALSLGRVSLIGVYGAPSDRRALVRLPSGRFVKVKVGDRVDGGRVSQIEDGALSYVKGGRNVTLSMPRT